jgi:hypothetical protein
LRSCYDRLLRSLATITFECLLRLDKMTW